MPDDARPAVVDAVGDGDSITLEGLGRVRLIGIDTPEVGRGPVECFGEEASAFLRRVAPPGADVRYRLGPEERDRYGRLLAYVWLGDGRFLNGLIARRGFGRQLTIPPNVDYAERIGAAVRRAREDGLGLWGRCER